MAVAVAAQHLPPERSALGRRAAEWRLAGEVIDQPYVLGLAHSFGQHVGDHELGGHVGDCNEASFHLLARVVVRQVDVLVGSVRLDWVVVHGNGPGAVAEEMNGAFVRPQLGEHRV